MARPKSDRVVTNIYISGRLRDRLKEKSNEIGLSMSGLITVACMEYLKQDSVIDMADMFRQLQSVGFAPDPHPVPASADRSEPEQPRVSWENEGKRKKK